MVVVNLVKVTGLIVVVNVMKVTGSMVVVNVMKVTRFVAVVNLASDGYGCCEQCDESDGLCG